MNSTLENYTYTYTYLKEEETKDYIKDEGHCIIVETREDDTICLGIETQETAIEIFEIIFDTYNWLYLELLIRENQHTYRLKSDSRHRVLPKCFSVEQLLANYPKIISNWDFYKHRLNGNGKYYENRKPLVPFYRKKPLDLHDVLYGEYILFIYKKSEEYGAFHGFPTKEELVEFEERLLDIDSEITIFSTVDIQTNLKKKK